MVYPQRCHSVAISTRYSMPHDENVDVVARRYGPDFLRPFESQGQALDVEENGKLRVRLKLIELPQEH